ncbi:MAG: periplasmic heavy metal sensor [Terracidiphilus sp.]|nr:periplasmic heavy metal sensor [Terracidiphilus sp.]
MRKAIAGRLLLAAGLLCAMTGLAAAQGSLGMRAGGQGARPQPAMERAFGLPGMQGRWWTQPRVVEYLKLTEEQQKAMDGILMEHREKLIDLRAALEKTELKLEVLVGDAQPNEGAIVAQIDKVAQARADLEKANARYLLAVWSKLTPEQRIQVKQFRANGFARPNWGPGQGGDGGDREHRFVNRPDGAPKAFDQGQGTQGQGAEPKQ